MCHLVDVCTHPPKLIIDVSQNLVLPDNFLHFSLSDDPCAKRCIDHIGLHGLTGLTDQFLQPFVFSRTETYADQFVSCAVWSAHVINSFPGNPKGRRPVGQVQGRCPSVMVMAVGKIRWIFAACLNLSACRVYRGQRPCQGFQGGRAPLASLG